MWDRSGLQQWAEGWEAAESLRAKLPCSRKVRARVQEGSKGLCGPAIESVGRA